MPRNILYNGREGWRIAAGDVELVAVPSLGGRIMHLSAGGRNLLFENPALHGAVNDQCSPEWDGRWLNFGGEKVWPAPQGWNGDEQWPGPPDPVLDGGGYGATPAGAKAIMLTSPQDGFTGLRISRRIELRGNGTVDVDVCLENCSDRTKRWSVWPVAQLRADEGEECCIYAPSRGGFRLLHGVASTPQFHCRNGIVTVDYRYIVGKIGIDNPHGWICYSNRTTGEALALLFDPAGGEYPEGTNVQIWTSGRGAHYSRGRLVSHADDPVSNPRYMEMELLSPLAETAPGECIRFRYRMKPFRTQPGISAAEIAEICEKLKLTDS